VFEGDVLKFTDSDGFTRAGIVETRSDGTGLTFYNNGFTIQDYRNAVKVHKPFRL